MKYHLLLALFLSVNASALPVLRETVGDVSDGYVTLYPDHQDPNLFYFLPNQMEFAVDRSTGLPSFSLSTYGIEQTNLANSFGLMSFVFRPGVSDDVKNQINIFKSKNPSARVAPLPVGESYMTIGESRKGVPVPAMASIFEYWDLPPFGGLLETEVGGNAKLTGVGAKLLVNSIKSPLLATLNSCYTIEGVTPMMDAEVKIHFEKVYTHFKGRAKAGWWIFGADVAHEVKKLIQEGAIQIRIHGDTQFEEVVMEMARQLAKEYLTPSLENNGFMMEMNLGFPSFRLVRFKFGGVKVEERKEVTLTIKKQSNITDVRCIAAPFRGLSAYADRLVFNTPL
jgi:hypothetical protein